MDETVAAAPMARVVSGLGRTFAVFDAHTQDSGNVSYGVRDDGGTRWFVKTSGDPVDSPGGRPNHERRQSLRRSAAVSHAVSHQALIPVERLIEAADGVLTVSSWFDGQLLHSRPDRRADPDEPFVRFQRLPADEIIRALDSVIDLHVALNDAGWTAGDLYDGSLLYDFTRRAITVIDLESYRQGSYVNTVGWLPGSTRFMAPEEFTKGSLIDARTTIFTLGRMVEVFLLTHHPDQRAAADLAHRATQPDRARRPDSLARFQDEWHAAADP